MSRTSVACSSTASKVAFVSTLLFAFVTVAAPAAAEGSGDPCAGAAQRYVVSTNGTTLHALAACHEQQGKTASAWAEYLEAQGMAQREKHPDVALSAKQRAASLESRLSTLSIRVAKTADIPSLEVRRDEVVLSRAAWSTPLPIDPGEHRIVATAPGKRPWRLTVIIRTTGVSAQTVEIGALEDAAAPVAITTLPLPAETAPVGRTTLTSADLGDHPVEPESRGGTQRAFGIGVAGAGLVGLGLGAYFGLRTMDKSDAAQRACPTTPCADRGGVAMNEEAKISATAATIAVAAGSGLLALGAVLFFTAPKNSKPSFDVAASPSGGGLRFGGSF